LLVIIILSGFLFTIEPFISSSPTHKGVGIGDSFAAPLDLPLNTDNSKLIIMPGIFN
jgi:hypothetical protein